MVLHIHRVVHRDVGYVAALEGEDDPGGGHALNSYVEPSLLAFGVDPFCVEPNAISEVKLVDGCFGG